MSLASLAQLDFAAGMFRSVARHLMPDNSAWKIENGLLDEDGSPYQRGGAEYLSTSAFGSALTFLWDGWLVPGQRTVIANTDDFGVLDGSEGPVNLGGSGLSAPKRAVELNGILYFPGGTVYAGSRQTANYTTGTVSVTNGSKTVTGSGTTWNTLTDAGMLFWLGARFYVVESIDSTTALTLSEPYEGSTASGSGYVLAPIGTLPAIYKTADIYAVAADKLLACIGAKVYMSASNKPHSNTADDYHELPGGTKILGAVGLGDRALIFATNGMWVISGLSLDLTDDAGNPQQRLENVNGDLVLLNNEGLTSWRGSVIAPCTDGVWLVDGTSSPVRLTNSITDLWTDYVSSGYRVGLAQVFRSHLFLPILDQGNAVVDVLVCRLDRPFKSRVGDAYPWTNLQGMGAKVPAFAIRVGEGSRNPILMGADETGRVLNCNSYFDPDGASETDPDDSPVSFEVETRDYPTQTGLQENTVRKVRLRYELSSPTNAPVLRGYYRDEAVEEATSYWGQFDWGEGVWSSGGQVFSVLSNPGDAPESSGRKPHTWHLNRKRRYLRLRFSLSGSAANLKLRSVELFVRASNKA